MSGCGTVGNEAQTNNKTVGVIIDEDRSSQGKNR